jgi:Arc/MetJ-type ribon-helix-helix transcriptional regulator
MKNTLTTSDLRDLTNDGPRAYASLAADNRAINELLNDAQEREAFEGWLDARADESIASQEADAADAQRLANHLDALGGDRVSD